jgi:glycine/D-amino acid oxidase-like deaminating enzyme
MNSDVTSKQDFVVIGGGFYGCCLALFLSSISNRVTLVERDNDLLSRASKVNQARVHTGFHYPRSAVTAVKSMMLSRKFASEFPDAIVDNFKMLYALPLRKSKVSAKRFWRMYSEMGAPIKKASSGYKDLFDSDYIEDVFECEETAFDYTLLRDPLRKRLDAHGIKVLLGQEVVKIEEASSGVQVFLDDGDVIFADRVFNVTYGNINAILKKSGLPKPEIKYELVEMAIVRPPDLLKNVGITVMDGPFFSLMPYPASGEHSLTHVRYSPHDSWVDEDRKDNPYDVLEKYKKNTRFMYMTKDSSRYLPAVKDCQYLYSLFEIKSVLIKNELNDGRPILFYRNPDQSRLVTILGGKIDNIYDLFDYLALDPKYRDASTSNLVSKLD